MRKKIIGKVLSMVLSAAMVMTSVVPSYAADMVTGLDEESVALSSVNEETYETDDAEDIDEIAAASDEDEAAAASDESGEPEDYEEAEAPVEEDADDAWEDEEYESEEPAEDEELPEADDEEAEEVEDVAEEESGLKGLPSQIILGFANTDSEDDEEISVCTVNGNPFTSYETIEGTDTYNAELVTAKRLWSDFDHWYYKKGGVNVPVELVDGNFKITEEMLADDDEYENGVTFYPAFRQKYTTITVNYYVPEAYYDGTYGETTRFFRTSTENADERGIFKLSAGQDPSVRGLAFDNWYDFPESVEEYFEAEPWENYEKRFVSNGFIRDDRIIDDGEGNATLNLYAHWTDAGGYTVVFDPGEGHFVSWYDEEAYTDMSLGDGLYFPTPADALRPGYILTGWLNLTNHELYPYGDNTHLWNDPVLTSDMCEGKTATFYAQWEEITDYELILDGDETNLTVSPGDTYPVLPDAEVRYGRHFEGWSDGSQIVAPGHTVVTPPASDYIREEQIEEATEHPFNRYIPVIKLEPKYSLIQYTIVYHLNVGTKDIKVSKNHTLSTSNISLDVSKGDLSNNSSFDSKGFDGWIQSEGYAYKKTETVRDVIMNNTPANERSVTVDLYAQWDGTDMYYNIAFNANGGSGNMETIKAEFNEEVRFANKFTKKGYVLWGFGTKKDGTGINYVPDPDDPDGNFALYNITMNNHETVTLYAMWKPESTGVVFYDGENPLLSTSMYYDKIMDPYGYFYDPAQCEFIRKPGYVLKSWNLKGDDGKLTPVDLTKKKYDGSFTAVYAEYELVTYTVTYHSNIGTTDYTKAVSYNVEDEQYSALEPGKITYTAVFDGNADAIAILDDHEITGWALNAGTLSPAFTEKELLAGFIDETSTAATVKIDAYAQWKSEEPYNVIFVAQEGVMDGSFLVSRGTAAGQSYRGYATTLCKGESIVLSGNEFIKKGYSITGWTYKNGDKTVSVKADATLKDLPTSTFGEEKFVLVEPTWSSAENSYKVTYDQDGGKPSSGKLQTTYKYSSGYTLPQNMVKTGYDFSGWFEDPTFTREIKKLGNGGDFEFGNVTLYAKFTLAGYTLKLDPNRGGGEDDIITIPGVMYDEVVDLSRYQVSYAGRSFSKWQLDGTTKKYGAKDKVKNLRTTSGEVTLVGQWNDVKHKVTYDYNGGTKVKNPSTYTTSAPALITAPTRDGYKFDGWSIEIKSADGTATIAPKGEGKWELSGTDSVTLTACWGERYYDVEFYDGKAEEPRYQLNYLSFEDTIKASEIAMAARSCESAETKGVKGFVKTSGAARPNYDLTRDIKISALCAKLAAPATGNTIVKLYAVYDASQTYNHIMYDLDDSTTLSKNMLTYKASAKDQALPKAVKPGYSFVKWTTGKAEDDKIYLDATGTKIAKNTDKDLALTPEFEVKTYNVTIDFNGATDYTTGKSKAKLTYKNVNYEDGRYQPEERNAYLAKAPQIGGYKVGYSFVGYSTGKNATSAEIFPGDVLSGLTDKSSVTLYAIWDVRTYDVGYSESVEVDGKDSTAFYLDTSSYTKSMVFGKKALTLPKPSKEGYTFLGWRIVSGSGADVTYDKTKTYVTKVNAKNTTNLSLKACFAENTYYITVNPNGGYLTQYTTEGYTTKPVKVPYAFRYSTDISWIRNTATFDGECYKEGFTFKGVYLTSDKAGKKPVTAAYGLTSKNKGNVTLYIQWEKVAPSKIELTRATLYEGSSYNWLEIGWGYMAGDLVEIQYSLSPTFQYGTYTSQVDDPPFETRVTGDMYYVRLRRKAYDSKGNAVYGPWSATVTTTWDYSD